MKYVKSEFDPVEYRHVQRKDLEKLQTKIEEEIKHVEEKSDTDYSLLELKYNELKINVDDLQYNCVDIKHRVERLETFHTTTTPTPTVTPSCTITPTPYYTTTLPPSTTTQPPSPTPVPEEIQTIVKNIQRSGDKIWNNEIGGNKTTDDYNFAYSCYNDKSHNNYKRLITYSAGDLRILERKGNGIISRLSTEVIKERLRQQSRQQSRQIKTNCVCRCI